MAGFDPTTGPLVLQRQMLRACRSAGGRLKLADSLGTRMTGRDLLVAVLVVKRALDRVLAADEKRVGVMLPPTVGSRRRARWCGVATASLRSSTGVRQQSAGPN